MKISHVVWDWSIMIVNFCFWPDACERIWCRRVVVLSIATPGSETIFYEIKIVTNNSISFLTHFSSMPQHKQMAANITLTTRVEVHDPDTGHGRTRFADREQKNAVIQPHGYYWWLHCSFVALLNSTASSPGGTCSLTRVCVSALAVPRGFQLSVPQLHSHCLLFTRNNLINYWNARFSVLRTTT